MKAFSLCLALLVAALAPAVILGLAFCAREHAKHAWQGAGGGGINREDAGMRVGRAHHHGIGLSVDVEIVREATLARNQAFVFLAAQRLADDVKVGARRVVHISPGLDVLRTFRLVASLHEGL